MHAELWQIVHTHASWIAPILLFIAIIVGWYGQRTLTIRALLISIMGGIAGVLFVAVVFREFGTPTTGQMLLGLIFPTFIARRSGYIAGLVLAYALTAIAHTTVQHTIAKDPPLVIAIAVLGTFILMWPGMMIAQYMDRRREHARTEDDEHS